MSKYSISQIINVSITSVKPYGAFAKVDEEYTGLIHISQINGKYIKDINNYINVGDIKRVKIIGIDDERRQLKLSMINLSNEINKYKSNKNKLLETRLGFQLFEEILPLWIDEKISEIEKEK
ncbi:MAG: S1 RNA-binding domain-containing protein [Bacilli bacterium]|nr:S1 RNA-binding domain-containing protein [Bacilli bacterium]MBP3635619.1 S1 RNA-binding domain-containing protein [Bacilli bacterium]